MAWSRTESLEKSGTREIVIKIEKNRVVMIRDIESVMNHFPKLNANG